MKPSMYLFSLQMSIVLRMQEKIEMFWGGGMVTIFSGFRKFQEENSKIYIE